MTNKTMQAREVYLTRAAKVLLKKTIMPVAGLKELPPFRVTCSWPAGSRNRAGECFVRSMSAAGYNEIFINPVLSDSTAVLSVLVHELIHACDDCRSGHHGFFSHVAKTIGLEGPMTATVPGKELTQKLALLVEKIGDYPHAQLRGLSGRKKQTTRMLKLTCGDCDWSCRTSQKMLDQLPDSPACPACPACGDGVLKGADEDE